MCNSKGNQNIFAIPGKNYFINVYIGMLALMSIHRDMAVAVLSESKWDMSYEKLEKHNDLATVGENSLRPSSFQFIPQFNIRTIRTATATQFA